MRFSWFKSCFNLIVSLGKELIKSVCFGTVCREKAGPHLKEIIKSLMLTKLRPLTEA